MVNVSAEYKYWDPARVGTDGTRRVPDLLCTNPRTQVEYVIDARIFWNMMSVGANGYVSYTHAGCGAEHGESEKRSSWEDAIDRRRAMSTSLSHLVSKREELGGRLRDVSLMIVWSWRMASAMWTCTTGRARNFPLRGMILCLSW